MWSMLRVASVVLATGAISACSSFGLGSDKIEYGKAEPPRALDVPPDLTPLPVSDRFAVPGVATASGVQAAARPAAAPAAAPAAVPVAVPVAPSAANARIERGGSQRWLAVEVPPEQAFSVLREFFPSVGMALERDDPALGIVETVWNENRAKLPQDVIRRTIGRLFDGLYSTGEQDRFRGRVERTAKNTSEIFISHRGMIEVYTTPARDTTRWQPRASDPELEAEMLQRLLLRFGPQAAVPAKTAAGAAAAPVGTVGAPVAAAAAPVAVAQNTRIVKGADGQSARLEIDEPFDRAWRRVGLGLDRGGFTVEDRDRTKGTYFVRFLDPEYEAKQREQQGFLSRIFGGETKVDAPRYQVLLTSSGARTDVVVRGIDGQPDNSPVGEKILTLLREQLR